MNALIMAISRFLVRDTVRRVSRTSAGVLLYDPHKSVCRALSVTKGRTEARKETRLGSGEQVSPRTHTHTYTFNGKQCVSARACRVFFLLSWPRPSFSTRVSPLQPLFSPLAPRALPRHQKRGRRLFCKSANSLKTREHRRDASGDVEKKWKLARESQNTCRLVYVLRNRKRIPVPFWQRVNSST